ncbi:hypothetical protein MTYP_00862 [Methylophilaceae bacterium]|nr:hypothetical protein MTYP_00862 [Methylophilaceae bacterium]
MPEHLRALVVILVLATFVFFYTKRAIGPQLLPEEFKRWRNAWFAITLIAFLSNHFWIFIAVTTAYLFYAKRSEDNKFALYFGLIILVPTIAARIPMLFDINYARILSLTILLPMLLMLKPTPEAPGMGKTLADKILIAFLVLSTILMMRGTTFTDALRGGFYLFLDGFLPYFIASRVINNFEQLKKVMAAFVLTSMVAALIGVFEYANSWLLYNALQDALRVEWNMGSYLGRGDNLRALASFDHSLIFGFVMMVTLGFYLFISKSIKSNALRIFGFVLILAGLYSSLSRGPWVGTAVLLLVFIATGPRAIKHLAILAIAGIIALQILPSIPLGQKIISLLPFVGDTDTENIEYRQQLLDKSYILVKKNPLFGVYDVREDPEMEDMVQGEGIIDIVNSYLGVVLGQGLVGLSLFVSILMLALLSVMRSLKRIRDKKSDEYLCGRSMLATFAAILVTIFTVSGIGIIPTIYWVLAGLIFSFARITKTGPIPGSVPQKNVEKGIYPTSRLRSNP